MTIEASLAAVSATKNSIKQTLESKNISMSGVPFTQYHTKISNLATKPAIGTIINGRLDTTGTDTLLCDGIEHERRGYPQLEEYFETNKPYVSDVGVNPVMRPANALNLLAFCVDEGYAYTFDNSLYSGITRYSLTDGVSSDSLLSTNGVVSHMHATSATLFEAINVSPYLIAHRLSTFAAFTLPVNNLTATPAFMVSDDTYLYIATGVAGNYFKVIKATMGVQVTVPTVTDNVVGISPLQAVNKVALLVPGTAHGYLVYDTATWTSDTAYAANLLAGSGNSPTCIAADSTYVYVGNANGIEVHNIADGTWVKHITLTSPSKLIARDGRLYAYSASNILIHIYDTTSHTVLARLDTRAIVGVVDVHVNSKYIFIRTSDAKGHRQFDISALIATHALPTAAQTSVTDTVGVVNAILSDDNFIYIGGTVGSSGKYLAIVNRVTLEYVAAPTGITGSIGALAQNDTYLFIETPTAILKMNKQSLAVSAMTIVYARGTTPVSKRSIAADNTYLYVVNNASHATSALAIYDIASEALVSPASSWNIPYNSGLGDIVNDIILDASYVYFTYSGLFYRVPLSDLGVTNSIYSMTLPVAEEGVLLAQDSTHVYVSRASDNAVYRIYKSTWNYHFINGAAGPVTTVNATDSRVGYVKSHLGTLVRMQTYDGVLYLVSANGIIGIATEIWRRVSPIATITWGAFHLDTTGLVVAVDASTAKITFRYLEQSKYEFYYRDVDGTYVHGLLHQDEHCIFVLNETTLNVDALLKATGEWLSSYAGNVGPLYDQFTGIAYRIHSDNDYLYVVVRPGGQDIIYVYSYGSLFHGSTSLVTAISTASVNDILSIDGLLYVAGAVLRCFTIGSGWGEVLITNNPGTGPQLSLAYDDTYVYVRGVSTVDKYDNVWQIRRVQKDIFNAWLIKSKQTITQRDIFVHNGFVYVPCTDPGGGSTQFTTVYAASNMAADATITTFTPFLSSIGIPETSNKGLMWIGNVGNDIYVLVEDSLGNDVLALLDQATWTGTVVDISPVVHTDTINLDYHRHNALANDTEVILAGRTGNHHSNGCVLPYRKRLYKTPSAGKLLTPLIPNDQYDYISVQPQIQAL